MVLLQERELEEFKVKTEVIRELAEGNVVCVSNKLRIEWQSQIGADGNACGAGRSALIFLYF